MAWGPASLPNYKIMSTPQYHKKEKPTLTDWTNTVHIQYQQSLEKAATMTRTKHVRYCKLQATIHHLHLLHKVCIQLLSHEQRETAGTRGANTANDIGRFPTTWLQRLLPTLSHNIRVSFLKIQPPQMHIGGNAGRHYSDPTYKECQSLLSILCDTILDMHLVPIFKVSS